MYAAGLDLPRPLTWVTSRNAHSAGLLAGAEVRWARPVAPRQTGAAARSLPEAHRLIGDVAPALVVSTGAALAVPFLAVARARGIETHYIESATRLDGPSLTGRIVELLPGARRYSQDRTWADRRGWRGIGSVYDAFTASPTSTVAMSAVSAPPAPRRIMVTLGGEKFPFDRAVTAIRDVLDDFPTAPAVTWQLGSSTAFDAGPDDEVVDYLDPARLRERIVGADVVIAHAGVGTVLSALESGKVCVVLPRSVRHGEHVDDHQWQLATRLAERELVVAADPAELCGEHIVRATRAAVRRADVPGWQLAPRR